MKNQNNREYIARIQTLNSEKIFLMELYHKLKTQCDAIKDRVSLVDTLIIAEQHVAIELLPKKI